MRAVSFIIIAAAMLVPSAAHGQSFREVPGATPGTPFVEQADPGAPCVCQVLALPDVYPPPTYINPYTTQVDWVTPKPTVDVLLYDRETGHGLLVKTSPYGHTPGFAAIGLWETPQWLFLRPGMTWTTGDLDGDGRSDLIGYDTRTNEVVRLYRRD